MAADGFPVADELLARLSSLQDDHITLKVREAGRVEVAEGQPGVGVPFTFSAGEDAVHRETLCDGSVDRSRCRTYLLTDSTNYVRNTDNDGISAPPAPEGAPL
jgi:hypothetical protein